MQEWNSTNLMETGNTSFLSGYDEYDTITIDFLHVLII